MTNFIPTESFSPLKIPKQLDLDSVLSPANIQKLISSGELNLEESCIAVIGASHSAILALKHLHEAKIKQINFYRSELKYAEYKDGWILYDNTGLKGLAAEWSRANLHGQLEAVKDGCMLKRIKLIKANEQEIYKEHLAYCTHIVQAIGYSRDLVPIIKTEKNVVCVGIQNNTNAQLKVEDYNVKTGCIFEGGIFGFGIAFPEQVTDKAGNIEFAVGLWKFMNHIKRQAPSWKSYLPESIL